MQTAPIELFAWIGEDEFGSGDVGLKQAYTPLGLIPLVAVRREKMDRPELTAQIQQQATQYQKRIRLARFVLVEDVKVIEP